MKNFLKKLFGIDELEKRIDELEKRLEDSQIQKREEGDSPSYSQVVDEWLNGKEGNDE